MTLSEEELQHLIDNALAHHGQETGGFKAQLPSPLSRRVIASIIDHTILAPAATASEVERVCNEAKKHEFHSVCVHSSFIPLAAQLLADSTTIPVSVIGFPSGAIPTVIKAAEAAWTVKHGALELDMVVAQGALKSKDYWNVYSDVGAVTQAAGANVPVKVILEAGALSREELIAGCVIASHAGARFVKTSTGFGPGDAREEDVRLMRAVVGKDVGVKASGGIRGWDAAKRMLEAGASRLGTSASLTILDQVTAVEDSVPAA
ncbi:MAG: hypothetical protein M1814_003241 [Vezdaea aestivalis]|nr:MAG: hypothetical protein M1814_003241 [Vezdaea aestivalis]